MGFFHPGAWCWAGLAAVIGLLYLWHFTRGRHEVATYWLWERALARRPAWFRLRFWLSLAAQIAILLLLVGALAEPYWTATLAGRRTLVVILDASASMSATDVNPSRLEAARAEAKRILQGLQPGERMAILSAGSDIRIECRPTDELRVLQTAIDAIVPTLGGTCVPEAVALARRMLAGQPNPRILVLTDGCFPQAEAIAGDELVVLKRLGAGGRNLGLTRLAVRPNPRDPAQQFVLVETANSLDSPAKATAKIALPDAPPQIATVESAAGAVAQLVLAVPVNRDGVLTVQLNGDDDLAADNQARVPVTSRQRASVFLVGAEPLPPDVQAVRDALKPLSGIDLQVVAQLPATLPPKSVVVLDGNVPPTLPACPLLVVTPQGACDLWELAGTVGEGAAAVKTVRRDSPLLAGVRFEDVVVEQAVKLQFKQPSQTLAVASSGDPLYSQVIRAGADPVLVLHVDLRKEKSDLALRRGFPRLIEQAVRWLSGTEDRVTLAVGGAPSAATPLGDESPREQGNLLRREESELRAGMHVPSRDLPVSAPTREQPLWMLLAGLAVALLFIEWCLFHRRVVV